MRVWLRSETGWGGKYMQPRLIPGALAWLVTDKMRVRSIMVLRSACSFGGARLLENHFQDEPSNLRVESVGIHGRRSLGIAVRQKTGLPLGDLIRMQIKALRQFGDRLFTFVRLID